MQLGTNAIFSISKSYKIYFSDWAGALKKTEAGDGKPKFFKSGPNLITPKGAD